MTDSDRVPNRVELVDYPAIAPADTQKKINSFLDTCRMIPKSLKDEQQRARITLASRHADSLIRRRNDLEQMIADGDRWLTANYSTDDEQQWIQWDQEYRAIWDALREGAQIAFGDAPEAAQAHLFGIAS